MTRSKISRYRDATGVESQYQPGSRRRVLKNKLGINRKREMDQAEYKALVRVQEAYLHRVTKKTQFDVKRLREMHYDWLGEIYEWAGTYRTVELTKGDFRWPPAYLVQEHMRTFESDFLRKHTPCRRGPLDDVAMAIAKVHAEFLLIHPFREGNGRLARWLAALMALHADYPMPEYRFSGPGSMKERELYLEAVRQRYLKDYEALALFFVEAIERRRT